MVLAVSQENVAALQAICDKYGVEMCDLGEFGTDDAELVLKYDGNTVGQISMSFLHDGLPGTTRIASWSPVECGPQGEEAIDTPQIAEAIQYSNLDRPA